MGVDGRGRHSASAFSLPPQPATLGPRPRARTGTGCRGGGRGSWSGRQLAAGVAEEDRCSLSPLSRGPVHGAFSGGHSTHHLFFLKDRLPGPRRARQPGFCSFPSSVAGLGPSGQVGRDTRPKIGEGPLPAQPNPPCFKTLASRQEVPCSRQRERKEETGGGPTPIRRAHPMGSGPGALGVETTAPFKN